jgi:hypothetical protein
MMTLSEAILEMDDLAKQWKGSKASTDAQQIADWLRELKQYREMITDDEMLIGEFKTEQV